MTRYRLCWLFGLLLIFGSACQLDSKASRPFLRAGPSPTRPITPTARPSPTLTPIPTFTPRPTVTTRPVETASPTLVPTPSATPAPTVTPAPSDRLKLAHQAFISGNYALAAGQFAALVQDPGADLAEYDVALYWQGRSELASGDAAAAIVSLKQFGQNYPSSELIRAAQFNLAVAYEQNGQLAEAATTYLGTIIPDDPINVYIQERLGDLARQAGDDSRAIKVYLTGIASTEAVNLIVKLREKIAEVEIGRDNPAAAIAQYDQILAVAQNAAYRAKILRLAGEQYAQMGDSQAATQRYQEAINNHPEAYDSYLALVELVNAEVPVDEFQRGLVDYHAEAYQPAIAAFERYLNPPLTTTTTVTLTHILTRPAQLRAEPSPPPRANEAIWLTGRSWLGLGQYNQAIRVFKSLIEQYPADPNWGQAHLEIGKARAAQDNVSLAKEIFREFAGQNPQHALAPEALWRAARLDLDGDMLAEAQNHLLDLVERYPQSEYSDDALYWAGRAAYLAEAYEQAADIWGRLPVTYPESDLANFGGYWQARALLLLGQEAAADEVLRQTATHSDGYYSLRARDLLAQVEPHSVPLQLPTTFQLEKEQAEAEAWLTAWLELPDEAELARLGPQIQADPAFQRGQALLALGLRPEALLEFETVKDNWWDDPLAMYQLALYFSQQHLGRLSIASTARLIFLSPLQRPEETPMFIQRLYYPIFFADTIFAEAAAMNQDPALIISIMRQESLFEPSAESHVGARGLMQVMPATGEYIAERSDFGRFEIDQLWHPYISIRFGIWYIDQQLAIFDGNQFAALAAYNAGPGNVLQWIDGMADLDVFVESIPFFESRLYVRTIYTNLAAYRRLYGVSP